MCILLKLTKGRDTGPSRSQKVIAPFYAKHTGQII